MNFLTHSSGGDGRGPRAPDWLYKALRAWKPMYRDDRGGVFFATFENMTYWRHTGEWSAYFWANVKGRHGMQTEKFVWTMRNGQFVEIVQIKPKGTPYRVFVR